MPCFPLHAAAVVPAPSLFAQEHWLCLEAPGAAAAAQVGFTLWDSFLPCAAALDPCPSPVFWEDLALLPEPPGAVRAAAPHILPE